MSYNDQYAFNAPYGTNPYGASPYGAAVSPGPVYIPGIGFVPGGPPEWVSPASQAYGPLTQPAPVPFDSYGAPAELQPFEFGYDDWGAADYGYDAPAGVDPFGAMTMRPYAGVEVEQTMSPEYQALNPEYYSHEAADAWTRAHMTPAEIEAERLRLMEGQYGSLSFWRTIGRALWQGVTLGWGDEGVAWYESQRRGTSYEEELELQRQTNEALRSIDPVAFGIGEAVGAIGPQAGLTALPWARTANEVLRQMIKMGAGGATGGAINLAGESVQQDLRSLGLNALIGAISTGPAAFLGPAYVAPWWNSFPSTFLRDRLIGALSLGPGSVVRNQIPNDDYYGF